MDIKIEDRIITFKKCIRDIRPIEEANVWQTFLEIGPNRIEVDVVNECEKCDSKLSEEINWDGVKDFFERLSTEIDELISISENNLFHLAEQMRFWREEFKEKAYFYLEAIEYLSVNIPQARMARPRFEIHTFQFVFTLENNDYKDIDSYGRWVTKWTGSQITGISRDQR